MAFKLPTLGDLPSKVKYKNKTVMIKNIAEVKGGEAHEFFETNVNVTGFIAFCTYTLMP